MVNRLFAFAKMDVSEYPVHTEPLLLRSLMQELTDEWDAEGMEIRTEIPADLRVLADRELLNRITANLLGNSRKYGAPGKGSGLGLAVVKKAIEEMGGSVRAENEETSGLRIMFTLPLAKEDSHAENSDR